MSAQSGTIRPRRTIELPLWLAGVIALVVVSLITTVVVERQSTSSAATRSHAAVSASFPDALETSGFGRLPKVTASFPSALETSGFGRLPKVTASFPSALETSGFGRLPAGSTPRGLRSDDPLGNDG
jgi:hypothetical protein